MTPGPVPRRSFALVVGSAALLCALAQAQAPPAVHVEPRPPSTRPQPSIEPGAAEPSFSAHTKPLRIDVDLVLVPVTVTDAKNHPVTGLAQRNFSLLEGDQPQQIRYFSTEDVPMSLGVVLDLSKSMTSKIDLAREAVAD